ncbi:MAG: NUDIX domain-containing protein [Roseibium sp.]|nr:NUDIX domain-containing protein [Roseibium sp.]
MELMILCAGAGQKGWTGEAIERPLRTRGKRQAQKIGAWLGGMRLQPDCVLTGSAKRAQVSAQKALKAGGWTAHDIEVCGLLSEGQLPALRADQRMLLVAPRKTVQLLLNELGHSFKPTAGVLLVLEHKNETPVLVKCVDPRDLPDTFPYPAPDGPERRDRPAYYYKQSAVIPYRQTDAGKEVLIVHSSSGRHWVVPKGIVEPGLDPGASAAVEASEEAGIKGVIGDRRLGTFRYEKWGATCEVAVYAMEVTTVLEGDDWEERHRTRKWVSQARAARLLHQQAFRTMVADI